MGYAAVVSVSLQKDLEKLHALSVELPVLELLRENMPYRTGGADGWNFEKAHSILHKVRH